MLSIMSSYDIDYGHFDNKTSYHVSQFDGKSVKTDNGPRQSKVSRTDVGLKQIPHR